MLTRVGAATRRALLLLPFVGGVAAAQATLGGLTQQGTGAGFNIVDNATQSSSINISGFTTGIAPTATSQTVAVRLNNLAHTWAGDVTAWLSFQSAETNLTYQWYLFSRVGLGQFGTNRDFGGNYAFGEFDGPSNSYTGDLIDEAVFGAGTVIAGGDYFAFSNVNGQDYGSPFEIFGGLNPNGIWTLSLNDAVGGDTGSLGSWDLAFNVETAQVPEPSTAALLLVGVAAVAAARRRRQA